LRRDCNKYFVCLDPREEEIFREYAMPLVFQKDHIVFANGDSPDYVYFIERGRLKIYRLTRDGQTITVSIRHPGELFGLAEALMEEPRKCFAQTLETTSLLAVKKDVCKEILKSTPALSIKVNKVLSHRLRRAEEVIYDLINYNVSGRLASFLLNMQEQCGYPCKEGIMLDIKLTHKDIANIIGSTRQSVTQTLQEFKEDGAIIVKNKKIILQDRKKLQSRVY